MTTTITSVDTRKLLGVSLPRMKKTYWEGLDEPTKESCVGRCLPQSYNGKAAWEPAGCLSKRWEDDFHTSVKSAHNDNKQHVYKKKDKHAAVTVSFRLYLLGPSDRPAASKPSVVVSSDNPRITIRTVSVLKKHKEIEKLGFDFVAHGNKIRILTGTSGSGSESHFHNATLMTTCGLHIISAPVPVYRESEAKRSTLGGVLVLGGHYYGLTAAHTFLHDFGGEDSGYSSSDDASSASEDSTDEGNVADEEPALQPLAIAFSPIRSAVYLDNQNRPYTDPTSLIRESLNSRESASSISLIGHTDVTSQNPQRNESSPESRWFCLDSDWALVEIQDSRFMLPNTFVTNGEERTVRSFCTKDNHPKGGLVVLRANREIVHAAAPRNLAGISLPWSRDFVDVWIMEFQSTRGDCGTWVVDAQSGSLFGVVVAASADSELTYVLPAEDIVDSIFAKWKDRVTSSSDMFPSIAASADNHQTFEIQPYRDILDSNKFITDLYLPDHGDIANFLYNFKQHDQAETETVSSFSTAPSLLFDRLPRATYAPSMSSSVLTAQSARYVRRSLNAPGYRASAPPRQGSVRPSQADFVSSLTGVAYNFATIDIRDYKGCEKYMKANPEILKENPIIFLEEAARALQAGKDAYARCCVQQSLLLRDCQDESTSSPKAYFDQLLNDSDRVRKAAESEFLRRRDEALKKLRERLPTSPLSADPSHGELSQGVGSLSLQTRQVAPLSGFSFPPTAPRHSLHPGAGGGAGPRGGSDILSNPPTNYGELTDESYRVQESSFFSVGRVFAILWHTNTGHSSLPQNQQHQGNEFRSGITHSGRFNVPILSHIQRMVVVNKAHGFCWCLPVNTYNGKGVAKKAFNDSDRAAHSIIYMRGEDPYQANDEPDFTKRPIMVNPMAPDQKLDPMSRLNFGKVHTVECNARVMPVGRIDAKSLPYFEAYWEAKAKESFKKR